MEHIPAIISRRDCAIQKSEMKNFMNLAIKERITNYIDELMYCSNSDTCFFKLKEIVERGDPVHKKICEVASATITQYEILDDIGHAKWV